MAEVPWIVDGPYSGKSIVTAPGASIDARRLDAALAGFAGSIPGWYRLLHRLGRWWYLVCVVAVCAVFVAWSPNGFWLSLAYGAGAGLPLAAVSGMLAYGLGRLQPRLVHRTTPEAVVREESARARQSALDRKRIEAILDADPGLATEVHALVWHVSNPGDGGSKREARKRLDELWHLADPQAAAAFDAKIREIEEGIAKRKRDGEVLSRKVPRDDRRCCLRLHGTVVEAAIRSQP